MLSCNALNDEPGDSENSTGPTEMDNTQWTWSTIMIGTPVSSTHNFYTDNMGMFEDTMGNHHVFTFTYNAEDTSGTITYGSTYNPTLKNPVTYRLNGAKNVMTVESLDFEKQ